MTPPRGRGRPRGVPNRITTTVKKAIEATYDGIGGLDAFIAWAKENPTDFYKLWAKLLPIDVKAEVQHQGSITFIVDTGVPRAPDDPAPDRMGSYSRSPNTP